MGTRRIPGWMAVIVSMLLSSGASAQQFNYVYNRLGIVWQDSPTVAIPTSDGGYALAGYGREADGQAYLIKLDKDGNVSWSMKYGANLRFLAIREVIAGSPGFVLVGWARVGSASLERPVLLRTDDEGMVSWGRYFQALDAGGASADMARATAVLIDRTDDEFVVGGYACNLDDVDPREHCRPFIAKVKDDETIMAATWLNSYRAEQFPDSKLNALAQCSTNAIVAAATSYTWDLVDTPLVLGVKSDGTSHGVYEYSVNNVSELTLEDVSIDNDNTSWVRLVGTATAVESPPCSQDPNNPDCDDIVPSAAWSGLVYASPSNPSISFATSSTWRTYREPGAIRSFGHRVTAATEGDGFFIGGRALNASATSDIDALLIKVPTNLMGLSGMRYGDGWGATAPVTTRVESLSYVPSGLNWSEGLLMSVDVHNTSTDYRGMNLIRSDLTGDCGGCQVAIDVISQAISPTRTTIAHYTVSWDLADWRPMEEDLSDWRQLCGDVY